MSNTQNNGGEQGAEDSDDLPTGSVPLGIELNFHESNDGSHTVPPSPYYLHGLHSNSCNCNECKVVVNRGIKTYTLTLPSISPATPNSTYNGELFMDHMKHSLFSPREIEVKRRKRLQFLNESRNFRDDERRVPSRSPRIRNKSGGRCTASIPLADPRDTKSSYSQNFEGHHWQRPIQTNLGQSRKRPHHPEVVKSYGGHIEAVDQSRCSNGQAPPHCKPRNSVDFRIDSASGTNKHQAPRSGCQQETTRARVIVNRTRTLSYNSHFPETTFPATKKRRKKSNTCHICNKTFVQKGNLTRHLLIHSGKRPFKCSFCPKDFNQKVHVMKHERTHRSHAPHRCSLCRKTFTRRDVLEKHVQKAHTAHVIKVVGESRAIPARIPIHRQSIDHSEFRSFVPVNTMQSTSKSNISRNLHDRR